MGKTTSISLKISRKTGSTFTTLIQHRTGSPSHSKQTRRNKRHPYGKEEVQLSFFVDDILLYIENIKDSTKKTTTVIHKFSKVLGQKITIQKLVAFKIFVLSSPKDIFLHNFRERGRETERETMM